jgi:tRNA-specific 2-thiouridylase
MALDERKDQSYVLAALAPESLARLRFPLGQLRKAEVRELAEHAGLAVARRIDSQDLCFLAGTRQAAFLERHRRLGSRAGSIVDRAGNVLGEHRGSHAFTVGQRHGLGIGGGDPLYVLATDAAANTVTVGTRRDLLAPAVAVRDVTLLRDGASVDRVRVRSHGRRFACRLAGDAGAGRHTRLQVELEEPAERTAPGQIACLYAGELVVGYGTITI